MSWEIVDSKENCLFHAGDEIKTLWENQGLTGTIIGIDSSSSSRDLFICVSETFKHAQECWTYETACNEFAEKCNLLENLRNRRFLWVYSRDSTIIKKASLTLNELTKELSKELI